MDPISGAPSWIEIINAGGVIGLLVLNVWMFASGNIVPRSVLDVILKASEDRTTKLADEIKGGIQEAVREGIVAGIHEVRKLSQV